jgi:TPR repeat protein
MTMTHRQKHESHSSDSEQRTKSRGQPECSQTSVPSPGEEITAAPAGLIVKVPELSELELQAEAGDGSAACNLGDHYRTGDVVPQDLGLAFHWYSRGAELGDREAQNNLGSVFLNGLGCERDPTKAIHWYRKSAEQGLAVAQYNLAKRYLGGDGIDQDYAEARHWFGKASVQGEAWASCELGTMHRFGQGVPRNLLAAAEFHLIAAEAGDDVAILGNIAEYHTELEEMALSGSQLASLFVSRIYNRGFGVDKSQPMTWAWIYCAKKYGSSDVYPDTAEEVAEAYAFYHMSITAENRKEGQKRLRNMRAVRARRLRKQP